MSVSSIIFVYIPAVLFWLTLASVVFAHFWIKYRDGVHRRARERETLDGPALVLHGAIQRNRPRAIEGNPHLVPSAYLNWPILNS